MKRPISVTNVRYEFYICLVKHTKLYLLFLSLALSLFNNLDLRKDLL